MNERDLFLAALEIEDSAARKAHLQSACADNAELLSRVESLLASHERESRFLQTPVVEQLDDPTGQTAATIIMGTGSTQDEEPQGDDSAASILDFSQLQERVKMADETPLGYLEPSTKPDSLGRLAHYEILEVVGQGAFGTVLRAFDEKLHRVVAIKVMAPELAATSPARKRFIREAQASAAIRHEHVVSVYAVEERPLPYLVMEYIPGVTLQQRLDERGPLDVPTCLRLGVQIAEGLAAAHAKDLIHRDIKPGNILLETGIRDRVKITDFGLARAADDASMTQSGMIAGTPMYMAPEQALGKKLDQRADLFSFGSVLYQMASGRPPFRASSTLAVLKRLTEDTPRPIREIIPETPTWLCDIITKLHAKNPDERYQTAREVADVLANCESQLKEHSRLKDLSLIPRAKMQSTGWWKWAAAAAVLLPLLAIGLYAMTRPGFQPQEAGSGSDPITPVVTAASNQGWVQLFNGKDLTGWKTHPDRPGNWKVEGGVLVGSTIPSFLFSDGGKFANFHLRVEAKVSQGGDSGIYFRSPFSMRPGRTADQLRPAAGYEVEIQANPEHLLKTGSVWDAETVGRPKALWRTKEESLTKADEWFTLEIIANGNRIISKVNGTQTADCDDPLGKYDVGHIALQIYSPQTMVQFRKIEIKELPPDEPGWVQLFNGKDLTGWKVPSTNTWEVADGAIVGRYTGSLVPLVSDREFSENFHLRCETKFKELSHGSVQIRRGTDGTVYGFFTEGGSFHSNSLDKPVISGQWEKPPPDTWFVFEIIAKGRDATFKINGEEVAQVTGMTMRRGHLGIGPAQVKGGLVQFRKIEIKELPPEEPGWTQLFNGQDLAGWDKSEQGAGIQDSHLQYWKVVGGVLTGTAQEGQHYMKSRHGPASNFHLRAEARIQGKGFGGSLLFRANDTRLYAQMLSADSAGSLSVQPPFGWLALKGHELVKPDAWFKLELIADGPKLTSKVNGQVVAEVTDHASARGSFHLGLNALDGPVVVEFKKIEIKELSPKPTAPTPLLAIAPFDAAQARAHQQAWADYLGVPVEKEITLGRNQRGVDVKLTMILIPPGEFLMGSSEDEIGRLREQAPASGLRVEDLDKINLEGPQRRVRITKPFYLSKHEITTAQFRSFAQAQPGEYLTEPEKSGKGAWIVKIGPSERDPEFNWKRAAKKVPQGPDSPVVNVTWNDANDCCAWLSQLDAGLTFALPTEAQWEYACRAGSATLWSTGDEASSLENHAVIKANWSKNIGDRLPNAFGLCDMHGNVWEWCQDAFYDYRNAQNVDPICAVSGEWRIIRGGSSFDGSGYTKNWSENNGCRSAVRETRRPDNPLFVVGFRAAAAISDEVIQAAIDRKTTTSPIQRPADSPPPAIAPFDTAQAKAHQDAWAKHLGVPVEYTNSLGMKFRLIPPGEFQMGSTPEEIEAALLEAAEINNAWKEHIQGEAPRHRVVLKQPFYLGIHEVTQAQYQKLMSVNPSYFCPQGTGKDLVAGVDTARFPVEMVSWQDAANFCVRLSEQEAIPPCYSWDGESIKLREGAGYRLPSEAEWEFACRAGTSTKFWNGNETENLKQIGWFGENSTGRPHDVGELPASPFGLHDMHGNIWEWVQDGWDPSFYASLKEQKSASPLSPPDASAARGARGGNFYVPPMHCRAADRGAFDAKSIHGTVGFRAVLSVDAVKAAKQQTPPAVAKQQPLPPTFKNSLGMEFVIVPKGKSWLGGGNNNPVDSEVDIPADFYLGKYEVTQEEWEKVMGENPSWFSRTGKGADAVKDISDAHLKRFSVESVSWDECQFFVAKLNEREKELGWVYRLPKEAEWEYACRGGPLADKQESAFDFYFAEPTNTLLPDQANFKSGENALQRTCKVGCYPPNRLGLCDMHGNVWELCQDEVMHEEVSKRQPRGGSWGDDTGISRTSYRRSPHPPSMRHNTLGLRLARVPSGAPSPDAKTPPVAVGPFTDADVKRIAALPAAEQVVEFRREMKKRNPEFDGTLVPTNENEVVAGLEFFTNNVADISPIRAFSRLTTLNCRADGAVPGKLANLQPLKGMQLNRLTLSVNKVSDLTPLQGMPLTDLHFDNSPISDLSPLQGMQLKVLNCSYTQISSLKPLEGMPLTILWCNNTEIADLTPVKGMPLEWITIHGTKVKDISPLKGMPLTQIFLDFDLARDGEILRSLTTLQKINDKPVEEFWKENGK